MTAAAKKDFLSGLANLAAEYRQQIEAECDGFSPDPKQSKLRRQKALDPNNGYGYFVANYFPHYVKHDSQSALHRYLFDRLPAILNSPHPETDAIAAPRGEAKSTLVTQLFVIWCLVTGRKRYPVIVMDSIDQAYPMLEAIKAELAFNPRLKLDFPEAAGAGRVWQAGTIITANDSKVQVAGSGKKLRGLRHGPHRPDLCVLDDIENDENVRSPEQREKLHGWLKKTVLPLGGAGAKFDVVYIGTILHYDSVLSRTLNNPLWTCARFKALPRWPDNRSGWEVWEGLLRNSGEAAADAYYRQHKSDLEAGSIVSWAARPLLALMKIRARDGHDTFDSEYQNDPVSGDTAPFANSLRYWSTPDPEWIFFGACDPSMGKGGKGRDPSAVLVGGYNPRTGVLSVVEASIKKRLPDRIIEDVIALQQKYRCAVWLVETVQFQAFFKDELVKRGAAVGVPVPARGVKPTADKQLRIETLQPHMANGLILLHPDHTALIDQLRHFPLADHDDGPDALHMLWSAALSGSGAMAWRPSPSRSPDSADGAVHFDRPNHDGDDTGDRGSRAKW